MEFSVNIEADEAGYTGRECPKCEKYFKIKFGTGLPEATECHCPYCNHIGPQDEFWTKQQIEKDAGSGLVLCFPFSRIIQNVKKARNKT